MLNFALNHRNQEFDGHFRHNLTDGSVFKNTLYLVRKIKRFRFCYIFMTLRFAILLEKNQAYTSWVFFTTVWQIFLLNIDQEFA